MRKEEKTLVYSRHTSQSRVLKSLLCFMIVSKSFRLLLVSFMLIRIHDKLNVWRTRKKSEPQIGFETTILRDLVGCSNH